MPQASLEEIVQLLRTQFGVRWEGPQADGRNEMMRVLEDRMSLSRQQAGDAVDSLTETGEITYHMQRDDADTGAIASPIPLNGMGAIVTAPSGGSPPPVPAVSGSESVGYWRIGRDTDDMGTGEKTPMGGRLGQIDPTS